MTDDAIPAGMKPWAGGDAAPADWDGGPVLREDRLMEDARHLTRQQWRRPVPRCKWNIIAYTPTPGVTAREVLLTRITRDRDWLDARDRAGGLGADTHAALRSAIETFDQASLALATQKPPVDDAMRVLIDGIVWTADPANGHCGMTLESDEVALLASYFHNLTGDGAGA